VRALIWTNLIHLALTVAGTALLLVLMHLQERAVARYLAHRLGWRAVLLTGWLGVALHETSHLVTAALFRHRIIAWRLFDPDPVSGTLGYVRHAYSRRNPLQIIGNFFIGVAPLLAGAVALWGLVCWVVPSAEQAALVTQVERLTTVGATSATELWAGLKALVVSIGSAIWIHRSPLLPLQLYLAVCITSHISPSAADLGGALPGGALLGAILAMVAAGAGQAGVDLAGVEAVLVALLLLHLAAGIFQGSYAVLVGLAQRLTNRSRWSETGKRTGSA
jgi:hypothetical protein